MYINSIHFSSFLKNNCSTLSNSHEDNSCFKIPRYTIFEEACLYIYIKIIALAFINLHGFHCSLTRFGRTKNTVSNYFKDKVPYLNLEKHNKVAPTMLNTAEIFPWDENLIKVAENKSNGENY